MARLSFSLTTSFAMTGVTQPFILYRTPVNHRVAVLAYGFGCTGAIYGDDEPGQVAFIKPASGGGNDLIERKFDNSLPEMPQGLSLRHTSPNPVVLALLRSFTMHPQSTLYVADDRDKQVIIPGFTSGTLTATFRQPLTGVALLELEE